MGNFLEIGSAARRLSAEERRRLLLSLAASLREEGRPLPAPRRTKAFLAQLRRQCRLANDADRRDNWRYTEGSFGCAVERRRPQRAP
jgi:hypothetical protein